LPLPNHENVVFDFSDPARGPGNSFGLLFLRQRTGMSAKPHCATSGVDDDAPGIECVTLLERFLDFSLDLSSNEVGCYLNKVRHALDPTDMLNRSFSVVSLRFQVNAPIQSYPTVQHC